MSESFLTVLSLSLSGAAMILIVLLFQRIFRNKISSHWRYYIWLLVVLRLLIPYSPIAGVFGSLSQEGAGRYIVEAPSVPQMESTETAITDTEKAPTEQAGQTGLAERPLQAVSSGIKTMWPVIVSWLWVPWLLVALILFIRKITLYQSFAKYVRAGQTDVGDERLLVEFGEICEQAGVKRAIELRTNSLIASPLLLGVLRPCVVLPTTAITQKERQYIYLHELTHYKRGDIFYKWLIQLALCLHWFNPLVHFMVRKVNQACELSCDESVIRSMDQGERRGYGDALLKSLESPGSYRESLAAVTLHENTILLKERLESIMKYPGNSKKRAAIAVILGLLIFAGGFALGVYFPPKSFPPTVGVSEPNSNELTEEGLPIMSASNRNVFDKYIGNIYITGLLRRNYSPEDISGLIEHGGTSLLTMVNALEEAEFRENDYFDGAVPADFADTVLITYFPLYKEKIREVCADIYNAETDTYEYIGGLGGGPALPVVTGFEQSGDLLTIRYTWYVPDPKADEFRYTPENSGELIIRLSGDTYRYLSNRVIPLVEEPAGDDTDFGISPDSFIRTISFEESIIAPLIWSHITLQSWQSAEEIDPELFPVYLQYLSSTGEISLDRSAYEFDEASLCVLMPADEYEEIIQRHFNITSDHLRKAGAYAPDHNAYRLGGVGGLTNAKLIETVQDGNELRLSFESYQDLELNTTGVVSVQLLADGGYIFISCKTS